MTVDLSFLKDGPPEEENVVDLSFLKEDPNKQETSVDLSFLKEEPDKEEFFERMGIRTDVTPLKQVTEYLTGKSPERLAYQSAVKKKPFERILAPLRGWLDYFENISGGMKTPDIRGALEGGPLIPPTASESWREKAEEGMTPEEKNALRKSEFEGMVAIDLMMGGLGGTKVTPKEAIKGKPKSVNPIQRKISKLDNILKSSTSTGEKEAALAAKNRLTGKYNVGKGVEKIAKSEGLSISDTFKRIWETTKKWGKEKFGRELTPQNAKFEEVDKFLEYVQAADEKGLAAIEKIAKPMIKRVPVVEKVKPTTLPPVPPEEPPSLPTKPSGDDPASPEKITESTSKYFSNLAAKVDVEHPFKKVGAPKTGFAVKNYFDQINMNIDKGKFVIKKINKLGLSKEQLTNVALQAESATLPTDPKEQKAYKILRSYKDGALDKLKKLGILKKGFHERIASDLSAQIKALDDIIKISSGKARIKLLKEQKALTEELKEIDKLKFVSIPVRELFDTKRKIDPVLTQKAVKFLTKKRRKTLTLKDLVDSGLIKKEELTPELIIGSYSHKLGRDVALAKIINAAKEEGLATLEPKEGMVKIPGYMAPELSKYYVNPVFAEFIRGYTSPKSFGKWEKTTNRLKGWSFYNPAVLGANNMLQHAWATLGQPWFWHKLPGAWRQAVTDVKNKTPNYWQAIDNGLRSSPFVAMEKNIRLFTDKVAKEGPSPLLEMLKNIAKFPIKVQDKIYDAMQAVAWTGGDLVPRMATYNWYRSQGMSPRQSAQSASSYHGDYSSVPAETRRAVNKFMHTLTFKIVMAKTLLSNFKNAGILVKNILKGEKIDPEVRAKASGLLSIAIILGSLHMTMKSLGYKIDLPGLGYKKDYIDDEGNRKTKHIGFSLPFTLFWKFAARAIKSATQPGIENRIMHFMKSMKFETAIPIQIGWEILENKNRHWKQIYDPRGSIQSQLYNIMTYIAKRGIPLVGLPLGETFRSPEDAKKVRKEFGMLMDLATFMFAYVTEPDDIRALKKAKYLKGKARSLLNKDKITDKEFENYLKEIDKLLGK